MIGWLVLLALTVLVMLMIAPLRAILGWAFNLCWEALTGVLAIGATGSQGIFTHIARCHLIVLRNFLPRSVVLPTVATRNTTRIE